VIFILQIILITLFNTINLGIFKMENISLVSKVLISISSLTFYFSYILIILLCVICKIIQILNRKKKSTKTHSNDIPQQRIVNNENDALGSNTNPHAHKRNAG
jgi:chromate transport protein ChrA